MKRILLLTLFIVVGTAAVCGTYVGYLVLSPLLYPPAPEPVPSAQGTDPPPLPLALPALLDVDALASRMKHHQEVYQKIRDDALAAYAKRHPGAHPYDALAQTALRLAAYLWVWNDFYGEGLWRQLDSYGDHLEREGCADPIWHTLYNIDLYSDRRSINADDVKAVDRSADLFAATEYPAAFKFAAYAVAVENWVSSKTDTTINPRVVLDDEPCRVDQAIAAYQELIRDHLPNGILFSKADKILDDAGDDETTLKAVSTDIDHAFEAEDKTNPTADILDGAFYVKYAWTARGNGYADSVTPQGWQAFGERLDHASQILTDLYEKDPKNPAIPYVMMTVVLGQQQPRDQMELWFQRGLQADPDYFSLYMAKRWYLLPRWYGSDQDVWNFGLECAASDNWQAKIPIMLAECISDAADRDPHVYAQPETWEPLEKVYRAYLDHYPNSVHYRSLFAKAAVQGEHWDVAREQFKILGDNWDRDVFADNTYADMRKLTDQNSK